METQQQSGVRGGEEEAESVDGNTKDKSWRGDDGTWKESIKGKGRRLAEKRQIHAAGDLEQFCLISILISNINTITNTEAANIQERKEMLKKNVNINVTFIIIIYIYILFLKLCDVIKMRQALKVTLCRFE